MVTTLTIIRASAHRIPLDDASIDLAVTSPPYPMVAMWDATYAAQDRRIEEALGRHDGAAAFELMHRRLDRVWAELFRVLKPGGMACINIGDAARSMHGDFRLYPNHARILTALLHTGFVALPDILWRKPTNAPNKFMGSGMWPAGAYVTYEHEYILIVRKNPRRVFRTETEKERRRRSAFFWEERNRWFSDVWTDMVGAAQAPARHAPGRRSAAFPFELAYRLVCMFSIQGDMILDPFLGTGTTLAAAAAAGRAGIGLECDERFCRAASVRMRACPETARRINAERLERHIRFVRERQEEGKRLKYRNVHYGFPVVTRQERELFLPEVSTLEPAGAGTFRVHYADTPS